MDATASQSKQRIFKGAFLLFVLVIIVVIVSILSEKARRNNIDRQQEARNEQDRQEILAGYTEPQDVRLISGTVLGVAGGTIQLKGFDPEDYLPHNDGAPRKEKTWFVTVTRDTKIVYFSELDLDANGLPRTSAAKISDIKSGMAVSVVTASNALTGIEVDAEEVRVLR